ncbi:unnamed protein product [Rotaria sp. Silwood2]|nr:unnamed protein product [Rotaria sp. Silwood2]
MDTVRDILTRRRALDPAEKHNLIAYVRHRRESIFQHVIGYNYDDNSIVGGLYTRVGIGSEDTLDVRDDEMQIEVATAKIPKSPYKA